VLSLSLFGLIKQVVTSWQVIATTVVLIIFLNIVFYVTRTYRRPISIKKISFKRKKKAEPVAAVSGPEEAPSGASANEELGLEEA